MGMAWVCLMAPAPPLPQIFARFGATSRVCDLHSGPRYHILPRFDLLRIPTQVLTTLNASFGGSGVLVSNTHSPGP